jgi:vancomycin permeability regulator SanA
MPSARLFSRLFRSAAFCAAAFLAVCLLASGFVELRGHEIVAREKAPLADAAVVFGAGLDSHGDPSPVLAERLDTGIWLLSHGKVKRLLLTGNSERHHDEVRAMRRYALAAGVPAEAVLADPRGESTLDSCRNARQGFGLSRVLLVTQRFHLPRALVLARALGLDATGIAADEGRSGASWFAWRELLSRPWALFQLYALPKSGSTGA